MIAELTRLKNSVGKEREIGSCWIVHGCDPLLFLREHRQFSRSDADRYFLTPNDRVQQRRPLESRRSTEKSGCGRRLLQRLVRPLASRARHLPSPCSDSFALIILIAGKLEHGRFDATHLGQWIRGDSQAPETVFKGLLERLVKL